MSPGLPRRIAVIGCPGSGKSTLAIRLAEETGLPVYHTDLMGWRPGWRRTPFAIYRTKMKTIVSRSAWIIEGTSPRTLELRFARADIIIWLSPPMTICMFRVIWRTWLNLGRNRNTVAAGCPERFSFGVIKKIVFFDRRTNARIEQAIEVCGVAGRTLRSGSIAEIERLNVGALRSFLSREET